MIVFNCTKSACEFFKAPQNLPEDFNLAEYNFNASIHNNPIMQWQLHTIYIQKIPIIIALNLETRYVLVFYNPNRDNYIQFLENFYQRLLYNIEIYAQASNVITYEEFSFYFDNFIRSNNRYQFVNKSDSKNMRSINTTAKYLKEKFQSGHIPLDIVQASIIDDFLNKKYKKIRENFMQLPFIEMVRYFFVNYASMPKYKVNILINKILSYYNMDMQKKYLQAKNNNVLFLKDYQYLKK